MKIKQVSVFLENKPGRLFEVCKHLADAGINLVTLSLADTEQFGILRLIVEDWEKAKQLMEADGRVVKIVDVVATEIKDEPGGLARVLKVFDEANVNVEYMYAFTRKMEDSAILILRFDNPDFAIEALQKAGIRVITSEELFKNLKD